MKIGVIIAARSNSSRLPQKALLPLLGVPMIIMLIRRIRPSTISDITIFATTDKSEDNELSTLVTNEGIPVFRGSSADVVKRYVDAARQYSLDYVVRVTGDCPFVDAITLDYCLSQCQTFGTFDLATTKGLFPVGIDYEIYKADVMEKLHESNSLSDDDREHLTKYIYNNSKEYDIRRITPRPKWICANRKFTIDTHEDYKNAQDTMKVFNSIHFSIEDLTKAVR